MARSFSYDNDTDDAAKASNESLLLKHKHHVQTRPRSSRCWGRCRALFIAAAFVVGCLEMIVLETILVHLSGRNGEGSRPNLLGELNGLVPDVSMKPVLFRNEVDATIKDDSMKSRNETRDDWLSYMPRGNGFIAINYTSEYTLPDPIPFQGQSAYSIAVFHQLHCLYTIMDMFNDLTRRQGHPPAGHGHARPHVRGPLGEHEHNHANHCFRYLRRSLLCCGDTALEGRDPNTNTAATDGTGAVHMCRDFEAIREFAEKRRLVDDKHP